MESHKKWHLTIRVQHAGDVEVLFGHIEGRVQVLQRIVLGQFAIIDEVWPVPVDEGAEG